MQLYYGDCHLVLEDLVTKGVQVDSIISDIPYNIGYDTWDKDFDLEINASLLRQICKPNANVIIFNGWSNVCETKQILDKFFHLEDWIIYDRIKGRGGRRHLVSTREDILWYTTGKDYTFNKISSNILKKTGGSIGTKNGNPYRALSNVWTDISPIVPWSKERVNHPTQKPVQLMERCVKLWTNEGDTVLDFTMGSGSTGVACINLNRDFIGIELNKTYYDLACNRLNYVDSDILNR